MQCDETQDCLLIDWFSFRCESMDLEQMKTYLGLRDADWQPGAGFYGFSCRSWSGGISIHYGSDSCTGVLVEMSGSGCRTYETFILGKCPELSAKEIWHSLFMDVLSDDSFVVTRLDVAFDDRSGVLPMDRLIYDFRHENFVTRFKTGRGSRSCKIEMSPHDQDATIYFGSPQSEIRFRIYDKSAERGLDASVHWIRFEIQLRRDNATQFIFQLVQSDYDISGLFVSVVTNYIRFVTPSKTDTNKRRWNMRKYWAEFVGDAVPASLWVPKTIEYNKSNCERYVYYMAGNSVAALIELDGAENFLKNLDEQRSKHVSQKIAHMVAQEKAKQRVGQFVGSLIAEENGDAILDAIHGT